MYDPEPPPPKTVQRIVFIEGGPPPKEELPPSPAPVEPSGTITETQREAQAAAAEALSKLGTPIVQEEVTLVPAKENGEPILVAVRRWRIGVSGDSVSWTVLGEGWTWQEALREALDPRGRRRRAYTEPARGGL